MQTPFQEEKVPFDGFGRLMGVEVRTCPDDAPCDARLVPVSAAPAGSDEVYSTRWLEVRRDKPGNPYWVCGTRTPRSRAEEQMNLGILWYMTLAMACVHAIQRGEKFILCHCTLLETPQGGVLLFGESGVGKSTASARWRAQGGQCISDDMALMDFSDRGGNVFLRRMPTWSAVREGNNEWNYPCGEEIPLAGVLALGRSESGHDEIVELKPAQYFAQCYRSMFYWTLLFAERLRPEEQTPIIETIRSFTERITKQYPPRALLTVLAGNELRGVIETYLNTLKTEG